MEKFKITLGDCEHEWEEVESMFCNEYHFEVVCIKCQIPGEQDRKTGEVFWPAT